ncbi:hypothetical protein A7U60_g1577 [Sanghuangporus baumii]|uniref:MPN domain-containing protein n=1 Tax=Sanghuangporus baumii TaxID=108892 RepID=A0A9Q5I455_SANBA|nr:hypothetical protein A7U60_g1577 [Sanghuangporus baumii]
MFSNQGDFTWKQSRDDRRVTQTREQAFSFSAPGCEDRVHTKPLVSDRLIYVCVVFKMSKMETDDLPVVLPSTTTSALSLSLHPLPILNISEHLTRLKLQENTNNPFVIGALLGTQNGREVEIVNSFELAMDDDSLQRVDHGFLVSRRDQYKQVFPSLELIGWYTVAQEATAQHIALHEQFVEYTSTPILLILQPTSESGPEAGHSLPIKAYEPTVEIRDRVTRNVFVEASYTIQTGEAERIAVDWTAKGGEGGTSLESHLQTQRAAVKMLHDRIQLLIQYVSGVVAGRRYGLARIDEMLRRHALGTSSVDHTALRSLSALIASLPASEHPGFREEFDKVTIVKSIQASTKVIILFEQEYEDVQLNALLSALTSSANALNDEYEDVQLTALLSALTSSANALNDLVDKHNILNFNSGRDERLPARPAFPPACSPSSFLNNDYDDLTTMGQPEVLTFSTIKGLFDLKGAYLIAYAWLFGMSLWVTFFGGVIAYKALPRQQFGTLQHRTFPVYFRLSIVLSSILLGLWTWSHPAVLANPTSFLSVDVAQAYTLLSVILFQAGNYFVIGPYTSKYVENISVDLFLIEEFFRDCVLRSFSLMFQRHKLEKAEGKQYSDDGVSDEMKALNKKFAQAHGFSSIFNLDAVIAIGFHGLWIGRYGLGSL